MKSHKPLSHPRRWVALISVMLSIGCSAGGVPAGSTTSAVEEAETIERTSITPTTPAELAISRVEGFDLELYAQRADFVLLGHVSEARAQRVVYPTGDVRVETQFTIRTEEAFAGEPEEELILTVRGGEVDGVRSSVSHAAELAIEDDVLLFVTRGPTQDRVLGGAQGALLVREGMIVATGEEVATFAEAVINAREGA